LELTSPTQVIAVGGAGGPGGCSAPGPGLTEYCYTFGLVNMAGSLLIAITDSGSVERPTTADVTFSIRGLDGNRSFVNVTLLDDTGGILATYVPARGWTAFAGNTLPIVMYPFNQTGVLNFGTTTDSEDSLFCSEEGMWGSGCVGLASG
jgi:hypothetical protein